MKRQRQHNLTWEQVTRGLARHIILLRKAASPARGLRNEIARLNQQLTTQERQRGAVR